MSDEAKEDTYYCRMLDAYLRRKYEEPKPEPTQDRMHDE